MLSPCAEKMVVFFMLRENVMDCFAPIPLPPKHHMKFFCEQIESQVAQSLMTRGISTCSFFNIPGKSMSSTVNPLSLVWIFSKTANSPSP